MLALRCLLILTTLACLTGCTERSREPQSPASDQTPAEEDSLTREELGNLSYPSELGPHGRVQLQHGVFEQKDPGDPASHVKVKLTDYVARGDLNADGREDAVVILETESGGSGSFMDLAAVLNTRQGPRVIAATDLGDRTEVRSLAIENSHTRVELIGHGPDDPVCCPTQVQQREYQFEDNRWVTNQRAPMP